MSDNMTTCVVISAGGTGGHILPALSVTRVLEEMTDTVKTLLVCGARDIELSIYEKEGYDPVVLPIGSRGRRFPEKVRFFVQLVKSFFQALGLLRQVEPDVVVGMGGYCSIPVVAAAFFLRIPCVLHEQNALPGTANKYLAKIARGVAFGFPEAQQLLPHRHSLYVGNPIRPAILESTREEGIRVYGVAEDETVILIIGGSLGAPQMNANFLRSLEQLDSSLPMGIKLRVLWSVGERTCETFRPEIDGTALRRTQIGIFPYIENVGIAYQAADIVVSRAGASTIAEIAACGRPSVLVPSPYVKGRHQHKNAMYMVKEGAAYLVEENDIGGQYFLEVMKELITDVDKRRSMASRAKQLGKPQAARTLAQLIMEVSQKTA